MAKLLVFAGTSEGRKLVESFSNDIEIYCSVATEYGMSLLPKERIGLHILQGRMTINDMISLMNREEFDMIIDTTHPYAQIVTDNIKEAARETDTPYLRLLRESSADETDETCIWVDDIDQAINYLNESNKKLLFTTGSKDLNRFTKIDNYKKRIYARVLPMSGVVEQCADIGITGNHLICMQGPFGVEMNKALIKQTGAEILVTKDSGNAGGFLEKIKAAKEMGIKALVIGRPTEEEGKSYNEVVSILKEKFGENILKELDFKTEEKTLSKADIKRDWFPMFLNISGCNILVVGGGNIATRRVNTLKDFTGNIAIVAPEISEELIALENRPNIAITKRKFKEEDLDEADFVIVATSNEELNLTISELAKNRGIMVNISTKKEACDFFFPGVVLKDNITVGVNAQGINHKLAKEVTDKIRKLFEDEI